MSGSACRRHGAVPRIGCDGCFIAGQRVEIDRLVAHGARLEESLRVALEARAEAVEVLRACEDGTENMCPFCHQLVFPNDDGSQDPEYPHADDCDLARVLGRGK